MSRRFSTWCVRGLCVFGVLVGGAAPGRASTRLVVAGAAGVTAQTHEDLKKCVDKIKVQS